MNQEIRRLRLEDANVELDAIPDLFTWMNVSAMGLLSQDETTGIISDAKKSGEAEAIWIPFALIMLMYVMVMFGAMPMINTVMEEKNQHIAEVILGSVEPFHFMFGKVLGGVAVSLTASAVYLGGAIVALFNLGKMDFISFSLILWFIVFLILCSFMMGSIMTAVGSACTDIKDAQNLTIPAMTPIMIPLFLWLPVIIKPASLFSTIVSLIPCFTPMLMIARMSTPGGVAVWQPVLGLVLTILFTLFVVWIGGRVFRMGILTQGKTPKLKVLVGWALKG